MSEKSRILGIDLGTTNTCVAFVRNKIPKVVPTDRGNLILPSVVALSPKYEVLQVGNRQGRYKANLADTDSIRMLKSRLPPLDSYDCLRVLNLT